MMNSILQNTRRPDISFYPDGRIDITARVAKILNLQEGDVIDIASDGKEYLLYRKLKASDIIGRHEGQCHKTKKSVKSCNNLRAYSKCLCAAMLNAAGSFKKACLPIGTETTLPMSDDKAVPIIYKHNLA